LSMVPNFAQQLVGFIYVLVDGQTNGDITGQFAQGSQITNASSGAVYNILYDVNSSGIGPGGDIDLQVAAVPEPGTWAEILAGIGILCLWQRSRRTARRNDLTE
jgi:hypothetical protein